MSANHNKFDKPAGQRTTTLRTLAQRGSIAVMGRRRKEELSQRAELRWPLLRNLMLCHFNEDYDLLYGSLQGAISHAVREGAVDQRRALLREWRDWNNSVGTADDIRPLLYNGFSVAVFFKQPSDARDFMNGIYDGLLNSVKADTIGKV